MSVLAACAHKAEWICPACARCTPCCQCVTDSEPVHINTKKAAQALGRWARESRKRMSAGPGDPTRPSAFEGGEPKEP